MMVAVAVVEETLKRKSAGWTTEQVAKFCERYKISCYALDIHKNLFFKLTYPKSNYPALIYYMIDSHMYPVTDTKTRNHIVKKCAENKLLQQTHKVGFQIRPG